MKKLCSCFYFLFIIVNVIHAQDDYFEIPDSLQQKTIGELSRLSRANRNKNIDNAIIYTRAFLQRAKEANNETAVQYAYMYAALNTKIKGDDDASIRYAKLCLTYFQKDSRFLGQEFQTLTLLGVISEERGNDKEATEYFLAADAIAEQLNNPGLLATSTRNLGKMK